MKGTAGAMLHWLVCAVLTRAHMGPSKLHCAGFQCDKVTGKVLLDPVGCGTLHLATD